MSADHPNPNDSVLAALLAVADAFEAEGTQTLFRAVLDRAVSQHVRGHQVRVVDAEGLILMKMVAFRPEDQRDVEALMSLHPDLDWGFVKSQLESVFEPADERLVWLSSRIAGWTG